MLFSFQSDDSDVWDDTALIKAYDKAVASFKVKTGAIFTMWMAFVFLVKDCIHFHEKAIYLV